MAAGTLVSRVLGLVRTSLLASVVDDLLNMGSQTEDIAQREMYRAVVADAFGWTQAIAIGAAFAVLGAGLILLVRADCQVDQSA